MPLAGVPAKAIDDYLPRLVRLGRRVAICEQVEDASEAEGIVRREVTEIVTPGATLEDSLLHAGRNNFVAAVAGTGPLAIATADLSTGEVEVRECAAGALADVLTLLEPAEVVVAPDSVPVPEGPWVVTAREAWRHSPDVAAEVVKRVYRVRDVAGFGLSVDEAPHLLGALGAVLGYLEEVRPGGTGHLKAPRVERSGRTLHLDEMTRRNLEVVEPIRGDGGATLLQVLDRTLTPMGRRMLAAPAPGSAGRAVGDRSEARSGSRNPCRGGRPPCVAGGAASRPGPGASRGQDLCRKGQPAGAPGAGPFPGRAAGHRCRSRRSGRGPPAGRPAGFRRAGRRARGDRRRDRPRSTGPHLGRGGDTPGSLGGARRVAGASRRRRGLDRRPAAQRAGEHGHREPRRSATTRCSGTTSRSRGPTWLGCPSATSGSRPSPTPSAT